MDEVLSDFLVQVLEEDTEKALDSGFVGDKKNNVKTQQEWLAALEQDYQFFIRTTRLISSRFEKRINDLDSWLTLSAEKFSEVEDDEQAVARLERVGQELVTPFVFHLEKSGQDNVTKDFALFFKRLEQLLDIEFSTLSDRVEVGSQVAVFPYGKTTHINPTFYPDENAIKFPFSSYAALAQASDAEALTEEYIKQKGIFTHESQHARWQKVDPALLKVSAILFEVTKRKRPLKESYAKSDEGYEAYRKDYADWVAKYYLVLPHEAQAYQLQESMQAFLRKIATAAGNIAHSFELFAHVKNNLESGESTADEGTFLEPDISLAVENILVFLNLFMTDQLMLVDKKIGYTPHPEEVLTFYRNESGKIDTYTYAQCLGDIPTLVESVEFVIEKTGYEDSSIKDLLASIKEYVARQQK